MNKYGLKKPKHPPSEKIKKIKMLQKDMRNLENFQTHEHKTVVDENVLSPLRSKLMRKLR